MKISCYTALNVLNKELLSLDLYRSMLWC